MKDLLKISLIIAGGVIATLIICVGMAMLIFLAIGPVADHNCHIYGGVTGQQVKYKVFAADCYVKTPTGWFLRDQINQNNVGKLLW